MFVGDLEDAMLLKKEREELLSALTIAEEIRADNGIGVTIRGRYQDATFVNNCRVAIAAELHRRIAHVETDLRALGVRFEAP